MKFTKTISVGNKTIEISEDSKVTIRNATDYEKELFKQEHWDWPDELPCQDAMWKELCALPNTFEDSIFKTHLLDISSYYDIWSEWLRALDVTVDGKAEKYRIIFVPKDIINSQIHIEVTYSYKVEQTDEWGETIKDSDGSVKYKTLYAEKKKICEYPQDYWILLDTVERCLAKAMDSQKLSEIHDGRKTVHLIQSHKQMWKKKRKMNHLKILQFVDSNLSEIRSFNKFAKAWKKISEEKDFKTFCESKQRVLDIDSHIFFEFQNHCGFDLDAKEIELQAIISKVAESNNVGEQRVSYAIEWFKSTYDGYVATVKNDCENQYRYNCITLCKSDFRNEPQEYDHILVCPAGVVLIETKHWKGTVEIRPDGKWIRKLDDEKIVGIESPRFQMWRHEVLMQKILPNIPIYSLLCFSNTSVIIEGEDNFKEYPIITTDQLDKTLASLCSNKCYSQEEIDRMVSVIETHKVYKV